MVAEGGAAVAVQAELVLVARILGGREESFREIGLGEGPKILREVIFFLKKMVYYFCLRMSARECKCRWGPEEGVRCPGADVTCEV